MEDALRRLDKLTQEEARMATAQNLKVTHTVDKGVKEVVDTVAAIDDRVARVNNTVKGVDDRVRVVDNKVAEVIAGALIILKSIPATVLKLCTSQVERWQPKA